jgi:hypothetical protein
MHHLPWLLLSAQLLASSWLPASIVILSCMCWCLPLPGCRATAITSTAWPVAARRC